MSTEQNESNIFTSVESNLEKLEGLNINSTNGNIEQEPPPQQETTTTTTTTTTTSDKVDASESSSEYTESANAKKSVSEILAADSSDESLRRYKEQLLGSAALSGNLGTKYFCFPISISISISISILFYSL